MTSFTDFIKGKFDGVSLGRDGRLSLAPKLDTFFASEQPVIWSVVSGPEGALYAATGHRGRVFRIDRSGPSTHLDRRPPRSLRHRHRQSRVLYAASSPDGKIYRIQNGKATEYFDPKTKYIWSLALAPDGTLYAGTGDGGRVFRITGPRQGEEYYATGQGNVTGLMIDPQGRLLAGTEPNGILYRITAKNKAFALYDASLPEIRAIAPNPDGSIYAVGLGGALAKKVQAAHRPNQTTQHHPTPPSPPASPSRPTPGAISNPPPRARQAPASRARVRHARRHHYRHQPTSPTSRKAPSIASIPITPSTPSGVPKKKTSTTFCLLRTASSISAPIESGRIYRLAADRKLTLVAQTNESEAVRLLRWNGALLAATANMGKIYRLGAAARRVPTNRPSSTPAALRAGENCAGRAENGAGSIAMRTRSGNSLRPDEHVERLVGASARSLATQIASPNARYLQYEAELIGHRAVDRQRERGLPAAEQPAHGPLHHCADPARRRAAATERSSSRRQRARALQHHRHRHRRRTPVCLHRHADPDALARAAQQLIIAWQADDPDGDKLVYELDFRGDGERDWKMLRKICMTPLTPSTAMRSPTAAIFSVSRRPTGNRTLRARRKKPNWSVRRCSSTTLRRSCRSRSARAAPTIAFDAQDAARHCGAPNGRSMPAPGLRSPRSTASWIPRLNSSGCISTMFRRASMSS